MKVLMYHYVRPDVNLPPYGYYHLDIEDFRQQLDWLDRELNILSRAEFRDVVRGHREPQSDNVVLTFDDGLIDHARWVLPELRTRDLWGIFFVPSGPYVDDEPLNVHRIHTLLGSHDEVRLWTTASELVSREDLRSDTDEQYIPLINGTGEPLRDFKRLLTTSVRQARISDFLSEIETAVGCEPPTTDELYMSHSHLKKLVDAGMVLGAHTVTHPVLSHLSPEQQREEITESIDFVDELVSEEALRGFAYPYGDDESFTTETVEYLDRTDIEFAVTTNPANFDSRRRGSERLQIPRRDCNEFPHGGASFSFP